MSRFFKFFCLFLALSMFFLMSGCTPEKAQALLTAIKSFESKSIQAINSFEQLFKDYRTLKQDTKDEVFDKSSKAVIKHGPEAVTFDDIAANLSNIKQKEQYSGIEKEFYEIKVVYAAIKSAYSSLPQGSMLGANYVSCGQEIIAKATNQLVNFAVGINKSPLYPMALRKEVSTYKFLASQNKIGDSKLVFNEIAVAFNRYDEKHEEAIKLTLSAVEEGRKVHNLLKDYNTVSVSKIMEVLNFGFSFFNSLEGIDLAEAITQLEAIQKEMDSSDEWERVKEIPISKIIDCALETKNKKEN